MPFEPGHKKYEGAGNPKGQPIKRSLAALELAKEHGVCPVTFLCNVINGLYPDATFDHKMAAAKELAPYIFPKLKSIELDSGNGADLITELVNAFRGK